jgi:quercetin dioxygenase-like cupin family protein
VPIVSAAYLDFRGLPGRRSADPFPGQLSDATARVVRIPPGPRTPHRHPRSSELVYVVEGVGTAWEDGRRTDVAAGDLMAIPPGVPHATVAGEGGLLLVCFFPDPDLAGNLEELAEPVISRSA